MKVETRNAEGKNTKEMQVSLFRMCWPVFVEVTFVGIMANLANILMNRYSADALTAVSSCGQVYTLIGCVFTMLSTGGSILLAPVFGGNKRRESLEITVVLMAHTIVVSLVMGALCLLFMPQILQMLNLPQELVSMGKEYLSVLLGLCVFSGIHAILTAVFRSMGRMRLVMANNSLQYIIIIGVYLVTQYLVPREKQSLWQYAMGTIYAQIATITIMLVCLKREGFFGVRLSTEDFTGMLTRWSGRIYYFGIRAGIAPLIAAAVQIVIIRYLGELGTEAMTARTYAVSLTTYLGLFNSTLTTVCSPLAGQYLGAGRINELPHLAHRLMRINLLLTLASCGVMLFAGYPLLHTFTSDEILLKLAFQVLLLDMIWKLISAYGGISVTILRAVGDVNFPFWIGVVAYGINIVISYVCGIRLEMGLIGIWCGFIAADLVNGLMGILRFKSGKWRKTWEKGMFD